ncbi:hypothetical protein BJF86_05940 [Serinicoccus sp. CNJ-927]|uniref:BCCT family transporter n=1 Tax=Serinicoccus sp. CNJ-927 TaxID=1904970 RepID=UPI00095E3F89|nr:BCCT family transporter [Serinicoccus sp. CNJ-927]OLT39798.1 hypothetical protein BJF86_05940 [Serinicoccus sp. CNJ-927]
MSRATAQDTTGTPRLGAVFWASLLLTGGAESLRDAAVIAAVPFTLILVALCVSPAVDTRRDRAGQRQEGAWSPGER